ncbi:hypothetical protein LZ906_011850 [Paraclostridium ghonii]|uniref:hypothetical protein n=1 Tax=Paraclostridium ghonii TaxID=29358 RepID=UPI00202CF748|nr:hypothetical protein [Paeniclostridium ghonii]MCM0166524.1 hypothetical protein [Paeniclostridium ghonii]
MKLRLVSVWILVILSMFMFGCNRSNDTLNEVEKTENKDIIESQELEVKMSEASYSSESDPIKRTMEESVEYVKGILPKGISEIDRNYESEVGVTEVTYKADNLEFKVRYMHPYKENGNSDEYDLNKTVGIDLALK